MPDFQSLLADPRYQSLAPEDQLDVRRKFFHKVAGDPRFAQLPDADKSNIGNKILFAGQPPIEEPQNPLKPLGRLALTIGPPLAVGAAMFTPAAPLALMPILASGATGYGSTLLAQKIFDPETNQGEALANAVLSAIPPVFPFAKLASIPGRV